MSGCSGNCSSCSSASGCKDKEKDMHLKQNEYSNIKKIYAVVSGKGGVGKSSVTSLLATAMQLRGKQTAVLDADVTGPSIPKMFGIEGQVETNNIVMFPRESSGGTRVMSVNLLLHSQDAPVVWRGPVIAGAVKQFWTDVLWGDIDYLFVDMPPGTGDVPLTVYQSIPIDGIIVVATPQDLVKMIVEKAVNMANMMAVPIYGIVENMSYVTCPDCNKPIYLFGQGKVEKVAEDFGLKLLASLPIDSAVTKLVDDGQIEQADTSKVDSIIDEIFKGE